MKEGQSAAAVLEWKEALLALSDRRFFELMRLYLGGIKTPFSKQRLVDDLSAFLQSECVRARVLGCLDELDIKIVAAVRFLSRPDRQKLVDFFAPSHPYPQVYSRLLNMEERLLIFRGNDDSSAGYRINPLFEDELKARTHISLLVSPAPPPAAPAQADALPAALSPASGAAAAGVFAFFANGNIAITKGQALKKKDADAFKAIFPSLSCPADLLLKALMRLSLLSVGDDGRVEADFAAWQAFARLSPLERASWLCAAASFPNAGPTLLARKAAVFALAARHLSPQALYSGESVRRLFLLAEDSLATRELALAPSRSPAAGEASRFGSSLQEPALGEEGRAGPSMTEAAVRFGLLVECAGLFAVNGDLLKEEEEPAQQGIAADSSLRVSASPKAPLLSLLPAARFLFPERIEGDAVFRIGREACSAAFAAGEDAASVAAAFEAAGAHLPQNALEEIEGWRRSFGSLRLYSGVVLKADERLLPLFREGGRLFHLVQEEIAHGVFLLAGSSMEEIEGALKEEGADFVRAGGKRAVGGATGTRRFVFQMELPKPGGKLDADSPAAEPPQDLSEETQKSLLARLDEMEIGGYARSVLEERIRQKTVISEAQLAPGGIRYEKTEAGRLDLNGKRLLAEAAVREGRLLEIETAEGLPPDSEPRQFIVRPARAGKDAVIGALEPDGAQCEFSLARAVRVRLLPQPIFGEEG